MNLLLYFVALALFISIIVILGIKISKKINWILAEDKLT